MFSSRLRTLLSAAAVGAALLGSAGIAKAAPVIGHADVIHQDSAVQDVYWVWHHHHRYWMHRHYYR